MKRDSENVCLSALNRLMPGVLLGLCLACTRAVAEGEPTQALTPSTQTDEVVMGWLEGVVIKPWGIRATAKLDTGAKTSSLNASHIEHFTREAKQWVRFSFSSGEDKESTLIERPLVRTAVIKERQSKSSTRDVVIMTVCKNGRDYETEFTLNDRSNFNYPILLGRSFLEGVALVDSSETFLFKVDNDPCAVKTVGSHATSRRD